MTRAAAHVACMAVLHSCERCMEFLLLQHVAFKKGRCACVGCVALSRRTARAHVPRSQIQPFVSLIILWAIAEAIGRLKACDVSQAVAPARRAEVKAADSLMLDSRALVKKLDISAEDGLLHVTKLDVRLAMFLVKKRVQGDRNFKSVAEIAQALCGPPFCCPSSSSYHARL